MVVKCSKCPAKLKINEDKIKSTGFSFKCPKCGSINIVKKPAVSTKEEVNKISKPIDFQSEKVTRPQTSVQNLFNLPVDRDVLFSNHKGIYKKRNEK
jgi:predicted Zn finger-like uncharacterized protein